MSTLNWKKGEKKKGKGKGKGKAPLKLTAISIADVDPLKLKWEALWNKQNDPHKGSGRSNYRAFNKEILTYLVESHMRERATELGEDPSDIKANIPPDEVPVHPSKKGKGGDNKRTKGEHLDSIENKRARLGGPACMPEKLAKTGTHLV